MSTETQIHTKWSAPYFGSQHLEGVKDGFQFTVTDYGSFVESQVFMPGRGFNAETKTHDTVAEAQEHAENAALVLNAFKEQQR